MPDEAPTHLEMIDSSDKDSVESLLVWIRERPHMYCQLAGELDSVLHFLHMVWAKLADREHEFLVATEEAGSTPKGLLSDPQRKHRVKHKIRGISPAAKRVLRFWSKVDRQLEIEVRTESWYET